jgi:hypothetical protein
LFAFQISHGTVRIRKAFAEALDSFCIGVAIVRRARNVELLLTYVKWAAIFAARSFLTHRRPPLALMSAPCIFLFGPNAAVADMVRRHL